MKFMIDHRSWSDQLGVYLTRKLARGLTSVGKPTTIEMEERQDSNFSFVNPTFCIDKTEVIEMYESLGKELRRVGLEPQIPSEAEVKLLREQIERQSKQLDEAWALIAKIAESSTQNCRRVP